MMDNKEARRITVIKQTINGKFTNQQAADLLKLSVRQVKRLKVKIRNGGAATVLHGNRGRKPHNALSETKATKILELAEGKLKDYNFLHMQGVLEEENGITISFSCLSRLLKRHEIKSPKGNRRRMKHQSRVAKEYFSELVQLDASKFYWFGDGSYTHLHAAIDDASNRVLSFTTQKKKRLKHIVSWCFR